LASSYLDNDVFTFRVLVEVNRDQLFHLLISDLGSLRFPETKLKRFFVVKRSLGINEFVTKAPQNLIHAL
jgi:hypothetical protein